MEIKDILKDLREKHGFTQEQLDEAYREWETCTGEVERMEEQSRQDEHH